MTATLGIAGSILLALCAFPEVVRSIRRKRCDIGFGMLGSWALGEALVLAYVALTTMDWILLMNYGANLIMIMILIAYKR